MYRRHLGEDDMRTLRSVFPASSDLDDSEWESVAVLWNAAPSADPSDSTPLERAVASLCTHAVGRISRMRPRDAPQGQSISLWELMFMRVVTPDHDRLLRLLRLMRCGRDRGPQVEEPLRIIVDAVGMDHFQNEMEADSLAGMESLRLLTDALTDRRRSIDIDVSVSALTRGHVFRFLCTGPDHLPRPFRVAILVANTTLARDRSDAILSHFTCASRGFSAALGHLACSESSRILSVIPGDGGVRERDMPALPTSRGGDLPVFGSFNVCGSNFAADIWAFVRRHTDAEDRELDTGRMSAGMEHTLVTHARLAAMDFSRPAAFEEFIAATQLTVVDNGEDYRITSVGIRDGLTMDIIFMSSPAEPYIFRMFISVRDVNAPPPSSTEPKKKKKKKRKKKKKKKKTAAGDDTTRGEDDDDGDADEDDDDEEDDDGERDASPPPSSAAVAYVTTARSLAAPPAVPPAAAAAAAAAAAVATPDPLPRREASRTSERRPEPVAPRPDDRSDVERCLEELRECRERLSAVTGERDSLMRRSGERAVPSSGPSALHAHTFVPCRRCRRER